MTVTPNLVTARDHLIDKGIPLGGAIALVSVLYYESELRPGSQGYQSTEHGGALNPNGAYGIASWNGPRQQNLLDFATKHGLPVDKLETQLDFVLNEMANGYPSSWAAVRSSASYRSIVSIIVDEFENPKNKPKETSAALAIAAELAVAMRQEPPAPAPAPPAPLPPVPSPHVPPILLPVPTVPAGRPPVTSTSAGRIASSTDTILAMREDRVAELIADDPEIAAYDAALAAFERIHAVIIPAVVVKQILLPTAAKPAPQPQRSKQMSGLSINWKTSLAGILAGVFQGLSAAYPQYASLFQLLSGVAMAGFGLSAKDSNVTGGTKSNVTGNTGAPVSLVEVENLPAAHR